jgi:hypothetical protein
MERLTTDSDPYHTGSSRSGEGDMNETQKLIEVRGGRVVRLLNGGPEWRAVHYVPGTAFKLPEWELANIAEPLRQTRALAQDVFCLAEDNAEKGEA